MSAISPNSGAGALVTFTIKVDGKAVPEIFEVVSIETYVAVNRIPKAKVVFFDGSPAASNFPLSSEKLLLPGAKVEILVGYDGKDQTIFSGVIVKQAIEIDETQGSKLTVEMTDDAIKMTLDRKNALFENVKDSDIIGTLITSSGLSKSVAATKTVNEQVVQYYTTDWDMMLTRAQVNGFVVLVDGGKVTVGPPDTSQSPTLALKYGDSILDLDAEMDASTQIAKSAIKSYTWDVATQKMVEMGAGPVTVTEPGNVTSEMLAKVFGVKTYAQQTGAPIDQTALAEWSTSELQMSKIAKIRGSVRFQGSAKAKTGETIELDGLGTRFNGTAYISSVANMITAGKWTTTCEFGMSSDWFAATTAVSAPEASGLLPAIQGLQTGIVKKVAKDPGGEFRVQVELPVLQAGSKAIWVRLGSFSASKGIGAVFYPEVGDEVIVGFMNDDPRFGVILGSVYSKTLAPPYPPDGKNNKKAIVTRSKLEMTFDDKDKIVEIKTPGGHRVTLDDKAATVVITDSNKNTVTLAKSGIRIDSAGSVDIAAKKDVNIQAGGNIKLKANANLTAEALQIAHRAKAKFSAKGNAAAELVASGICTVKGALVKIN